MTAGIALQTGLALLLLVLGGWTIVVRNTFAAVVGFVAFGIVLALVWVRLHALDVALTEAALGSGLTGVLLLGAAARLRDAEARADALRPGRWVHMLAAVASIAVAGVLAVAMLLLPEPAPTLAPAVSANLDATGLGNPVAGVLLAFRATDTLLEVVVLLLALVGAWSLAPDGVWGGLPGLHHRADPDGVLAYAARRLPPFGIVVGLYLFYVGSNGPGGEFQAATVLAAMWLLAMLAGLTQAPPIGNRTLRWVLVVGPIVFVVIGVAGMFTAGAFLAYPVPWAKPLILTIEAVLTLSIAAALGMLMAGAPERTAAR